MRSPGRRRLALALVLSLTAIVSSLGAQTLNPVVTVLPRATGTVPQDCEQGLTAAPAPRVTPEEKTAAVAETAPAVPVAPPSATLREVLRDLQAAAQRGDREAFRTLSARAKSMVANYPPGAEKNAANEALKVYDDVEAFLDYQYDTPTGAFFDASTDGLLARMKAYPDYQRAIADQTIVDASGTRFYPTRETREFLVREADARLRGVSVSKPVAEKPPAPVPATRPPKPSPGKPPVTTAHGTTKHPAATTPKQARPAPAKKPAHPAVAKPAPTKTATKREPVKIAEKHEPVKTAQKREPVKIAEKREPAKIVTKPAPVPQPAPAPTPATQTVAPPPAPTTTTAAAATTGTTTTTAASTATGGTTQPASTPSRRKLIIPLILIVVGVGVLIFLFRRSS